MVGRKIKINDSLIIKRRKTRVERLQALFSWSFRQIFSKVEPV